ncbi:MAG: hypothetical protein PHO86_02920 [Bacilli bacterium]|nr:hypothetical protein [Bacilli bacterium]
MTYLLEGVSITLGLGLIIFIANSIITTMNPKIRGLINLIIGIFLIIIFVLAYILDNYFFKVAYYPYVYYIFGGVSILYTLTVPTILFIRGERQGFSLKRNKLLYTTDKSEYMYIIYRHKDKIFLKNNRGIIIKMNKRAFEDQVIETLNKKLNINVDEDHINKYGTVTAGSKKKSVYSCYLIDIDDDLNIQGFIPYDKYEVVNINGDYLDKQIILRLMLEEKFNIIL